MSEARGATEVAGARRNCVATLALAVLIGTLLLFISILLRARTSNSDSSDEGGTCGGFGPPLTSTGTFRSHTGAGYSTYDANAACSATITAPSGSTITFALTYMDTERGYDFVDLFDGPSTSSPLLDTFSGASLGSWSSTGNRLTVRFSTDGTASGYGFTASVSFSSAEPSAAPMPSRTSNPAANVLVPGGSCGGPSGSFTSPGTLKSHAGAGNIAYGNGWVCTATITAPLGSVINFALSFMDTEGGYDFLELFDGPSTSSPLLTSSSGSALAAWTTSSPTLTLRFSTDSFGVGKGFIAAIGFGAAAGWSASSTPSPSSSPAPLPSLVVCAAGFFSSSPYACQRCPANTFSEAGASLCTPCRFGSWSASGAAACTVECPAGSYPYAGTCQSCPAGTASVARSLFCTPCAPGSSSGSGAAACTLCPAGKWSAACDSCASAGQCTACPASQYSTEGAPACAFTASTCPAGTFASPPAACTACSVGTYAPTSGGTSAGACLPCPAGFSCRAGSATPCGAGLFSLAGAGACCRPGFFNAPTSTLCTPCPEKTFLLGPASSAQACVPCPVGLTSPGGVSACLAPQSLNASSCPAGMFAGGGAGEAATEAAAAGSCISCPIGRFGPLASAPDASYCFSCTAGTFSSQSGATFCKRCSNSSLPVEDASACQACPEWTLSTGSGDACGLCPAGLYCPAGADAPLSCANFALDGNPCGSGGCVAGYAGALCSKCARGYYRSTSDFGKSTCERCTFTWGMWAVISIGALVFFCIVAALFTCCAHLETEYRDKGVESGTITALQSLWGRFTALRDLNGIPFPPIFRIFLGWLTSLFAFAASIHPECTFGDFDFSQQWGAVIGGFFVLLAASFVVDRCRKNKGFYLMDNLVLALLLPQALQFSFQAVTCVENAAGGLVLYVEPSLPCPFPSRSETPINIQVIGGFSVLFIIVFVPLKLMFAWYQTAGNRQPFLLLFQLLDVVRQCMAPLSVPSPVAAVTIMFLTSIAQFFTVYASWTVFWNCYGIAQSVDLRILLVISLTLVIDCVLIQVVRAGPYEPASGLRVGIFLIVLTGLVLLSLLLISGDGRFEPCCCGPPCSKNSKEKIVRVSNPLGVTSKEAPPRPAQPNEAPGKTVWIQERGGGGTSYRCIVGPAGHLGKTVDRRVLQGYYAKDPNTAIVVSRSCCLW